MSVFEYLLFFFLLTAQPEKIQKALKTAENDCMKIILDVNVCTLYAFGGFGKNSKGLIIV